MRADRQSRNLIRVRVRVTVKYSCVHLPTFLRTGPGGLGLG